MNTSLFIFVTASGGNYATNRVRGNTGNSTSDPATAALRLAQKLFGPALQGVNRVADENHYVTKWEITADPLHYASCSPDGALHFGNVIPVTHTAVASGPARALVQVVRAFATLGVADANTLQASVPGVAQAATQQEKDAALLAWAQRCANAVTKKTSLGVTFETTIRRAAL